MHGSIAAFSRLNTLLCRISLWLGGFGLIAMTVIVFAQVFMRYVMGSSLLWVEPVAILLMSWFIFLGSAVGVHEKFHMGFEVLLYFLPPGFGRWLRLIADLSIFAFAVCMIWYGGQLMLKTWDASLPVIRLPGGFTYMPVAAGGALMALFMLEHILRNLFGVTAEAQPEDMPLSEV